METFGSWIVNLKLRQRGSLRAVTGFWGRSLLLLILPAASYYLVAGVVGLLATAVLR